MIAKNTNSDSEVIKDDETAQSASSNNEVTVHENILNTGSNDEVTGHENITNKSANKTNSNEVINPEQTEKSTLKRNNKEK